MLMHKGIGLELFNAMPEGRAVHALYECCCNVTWAQRVAQARPYADHDAVFEQAEIELLELSQADLDRVFDSCIHEPAHEQTVEVLAKITHSRVKRMLGPEGGYSEY
ncbi:MAG TPA: 2-oxo-4-hydroxy-4-carboxy-5-ureidoimidazoline decarboxylase [Aldersonia sp.]